MKSLSIQALLLFVFALLASTSWSQPPNGQLGPPRGREGRPGRELGEGPQGDFHPPMHPLFKALDANEDDEISAEEIENATTALKKLDKNNDGKLTHDELRPEGGPGVGRPGQGRFGGQDRGGFRQERGDSGPGHNGFRRPGQGGQDKAAGIGFADQLMSYDDNNDGNVTKNELLGSMQRIFQRGDLNKDGAIDKDEAEKLTEQFEQARGGRGGRGGMTDGGRGGRRGISGGGRGSGRGRPDEERPRRPR